MQKVRHKNLEMIRRIAPAQALFKRTQVAASFEPNEFKRKTKPELEATIEATWKEKQQENGRLYNASKFRLAGWKYEAETLQLNVGMTSYKDLFGTNLSDDRARWQEQGLHDYGEEQTYMSDCLGVGILLFTSDQDLILIRRANWTAEYPGLLDRPGGHPEPSNIIPSVEHCACKQLANELVMNEIWSSAVQEVEDEIGISTTFLQDIQLMGINLNSDTAGRPGLEFCARVNMSTDDVKKEYLKGKQKEADETSALILVSPNAFEMIMHLIPNSCHNMIGTGLTTKEITEKTNYSPQDLEMANKVATEATPALRGAILLGIHGKIVKQLF